MLYQSGGKLGPHEHLCADKATIFKFPKSKNWIKLKKSLFGKKNCCSMKYLLPKQTYMQNLISIG